MVKKLTKAAEEKLMTALNRIADLTNDGMEPNEAITKVASASQIPVGHIQLLVNAYNTGRTTAQRRSSDDVWSKVAEFPLADAATILERMFPERVKTAAEEEQENVVSYEYGVSPGWVDRMKAAESRARKIDWKMIPTPPEPYPSEKNEYKTAQTQIKRFKVRAEEARYKAAATFTYAIQAKERLADFFKVAGCVPFQEVRANAELLYGISGKALFDQLAQENPKFTKQASTKKLSAAKGPVYDALAGCMELTDAYTALKTDYEIKEAEASRKQKELLEPFVPQVTKEAAGFGSNFKNYFNKGTSLTGWKQPPSPSGGTPAPGTPTPSNKPPSPILQPFQLLGEGFGGMAANRYMNQMDQWRAKTRDDVLKDKTVEQFKNTFEPQPDQHLERQLDALNQNATLNDVISGDDVLAYRNPHSVIDAFSHLRRFAPHLANDREMLRTYLRKKLEGGMGDIFDQKTMLETEKLLRDIEPKSEFDQQKEKEEEKGKDKK
jgi:hypothetical protein